MRGFFVFVCLLIVILNLSLLSIAGYSNVVKKQQQISHKQELKMSNWQKISCLSQAIVAILTLVLIILVCIELRQDSKYRMYEYLANLYYKIFEIGIERPKLINENKTKNYQSSFTEDEAARYDAYAHMVWGHAEDIFDRATTKKYKRLLEIYGPLLKEYYRLHGKWYENNKRFFIKGFDKFIKRYDPN